MEKQLSLAMLKKERKKEKGKKKEKMLFYRIASYISSGCEVTSNLK
jgi:hypothetical protein